MSCDMKKAVFAISDQVQHKLAYTVSEESKILYILGIGGGIVLIIRVAKTKALISCALNYCTADLHLCFRIGKNPVFS